MNPYANQEHRPLKRSKHGAVGPEVYPQDKKQKEDELSQFSVKHGFSNISMLKDEYGSARDASIQIGLSTLSNKVVIAFANLMAKKYEINTFPDQSKRKLPIANKDNFYPIGIPKGKQLSETWFKEDLAGNKPLAILAKKVPVFIKKEDIFQKLSEENAPLLRAIWFIKMTNTYNVAMYEVAKSKKRHTLDPFNEWTQALVRYIKELIQKLIDISNVSNHSTYFMTSMKPDLYTSDTYIKQWNYVFSLSSRMYEEGLLDRQEFLTMIIHLLEKTSDEDLNILKLVLAQALKFSTEFVQSQVLSRLLANFCCLKISELSCDGNNSCTSPMPTENIPSNQVKMISSFLSCPLHRSLVLQLSAILHTILLRCPAALVWHKLSNDKQFCPLNGSPLDYLAISIASLPLTATVKDENVQIRAQLKVAEDQVVNRSRLSEQLWPSDKNHQSDIGVTINRILDALEILDHENIDQFENLQTIENLYAKIFQHNLNKEPSTETVEKDEALVELLCEWAVTTKRSGLYRPIIVTKLLERYQNFLLSEKNDGDQTIDGEHAKSNIGNKPILQNILLKFLDNKAPLIDQNSDSYTKQAFSNLVLLFGELISHEIFSHDQYICTLVARGDLHMAHHMISMIQSIRADNCPSNERQDSVHHFVKNENENMMDIEMETMHQFSRQDIRSIPDLSGRAMLSPYFTNPTLVIPSSFSHPNSARTPGGPTTPASVKSSAPHTPGTAHTPSGQLTPVGGGNMYTPGGGNVSFQSGSYGMMHTPGSGGQAHTPGSASQAHSQVRSITPGSSGILQSQMMGHGHLTQGIQSGMQSGILPSYCSSFNNYQEVELNKNSMRHLVFVTHFPVTSYDSCSHENNQRMVVLYGVGKPRDEVRHAIRKVTRDLSKILFSKRGSCIDATTGEVGKKDKRKKDKESSSSSLSLQSLPGSLPSSLSLLSTYNIQAPSAPQVPHPDTGFNESFIKFKRLPIHDQHLVAHSLSRTLLELISSFLNGSLTYLPSVDSISILFDIMESSNILTHLINITINLISKAAELEVRLTSLSSPLVSTYPNQLSLCLIAVLRKLSNCIFITNNSLAIIFESLMKLVRNIERPHECTSTDRCILVYLFEIFTGSNFIKGKFFDTFSPMFERIKATIFDDVEPSSCNLRWDQEFSRTVLSVPKIMPDVNFIRQLNCKESAYDRYSFVCSVLVSICSSQDGDRINDLSVLCCDLTSCCNRLTSDWLGVLKALCLSSNHNCGFIDMLTQVEVTDLSIHDSLAVFTSILVARNCLPLEEFVHKVALPSLLASCRTTPSGSDNDADCEPGARLTLHLLLRLFQSGSSSVNMNATSRGMHIHAASNRRLLHAVRKKIEMGAVVAVLKAVLMLGDYDTSFNQYPRNTNIFSSQFFDEPMDSSSKNRFRGENANLGEYARTVLVELCRQDWIREKCLSDPDQLLTSDMLLDKLLSHNQARHLAQMICHANNNGKMSGETEGDFEKKINPIGQMLQSLNQWTLRVSLLELQLLVKQTNSNELTSLLDSIAMSTIDALQQHSESKPKFINFDEGNLDSIWFLAPLISRMPIVQGRILKAVGQVLESGSNFSNSKNTRDREKNLQKSASLLSNQSLLNLIMLCLTNPDEESEAEALLKSLHDQLEKFVNSSKEQNDRGVENQAAAYYDALRLRLSLVGSMFSLIQRNQNLLHDWSLLFIQLICSGIVDIQTNSTLFTMIIDMLATLIDGIVPPIDSNDTKTEELRKAHHSLIRKLKKELGDRKSSSIDEILKLLPLPKKLNEVIVCEPVSSAESKNKSETPIEKSLQISRKELLNPWDIIETQKNPSVLSLSWFGASRRERKPLTYEDQHRLLLYHTHSSMKSDAFFLEPPLLPTEEFDQPIEKQEVKQLDQILEQKIDPSKNKKNNRVRLKNKTPTSKNPTPNPGFLQPTGPVPSMGFQRPDVYPGNIPINVYYNQPYTTVRSFNSISNPRQALKTRIPYIQTGSIVQNQWASQRPRGLPGQRLPRMMVDTMFQGVPSQGQSTATIIGQNFGQQSVSHQGFGAGYSTSIDPQHTAQFKQQASYPAGTNNQTVNRYASMQNGGVSQIMGSSGATVNPSFNQMTRSSLNPANQTAVNFQNNPQQQQQQQQQRMIRQQLMMQSNQQPQQMMQTSQQMLQHHTQITPQQMQQQLQQRQNSQNYSNYQTF